MIHHVANIIPRLEAHALDHRLQFQNLKIKWDEWQLASNPIKSNFE